VPNTHAQIASDLLACGPDAARGFHSTSHAKGSMDGQCRTAALGSSIDGAEGSLRTARTIASQVIQFVPALGVLDERRCFAVGRKAYGMTL
jgi:hypothetical protein